MPKLKRLIKEKEIFLDKEYRNSIAALDRLITIQENVITCQEKKVAVNIVNTVFITPAFLILVATLPELGDMVSKQVVLKHNTGNKKLYDTLSAHGVLQYYHVLEAETRRDIIPLCKIISLEHSSELVNRILDLAPVEMTEKAKATINSKLYEIVINAETHGKNSIGTFCHGFLDRSKKKFIFSIYDFGIGIQKNVNNFLKEELSTVETMKWALQEGNSTLVTDYPRGAGFSLLEKFARLNDGKIWICSDDIICKIENSKKVYHKLSHHMIGTLFIMNIKADSEYIYTVK